MTASAISRDRSTSTWLWMADSSKSDGGAPASLARPRQRRFPLLDQDARVGGVERVDEAEADIGADRRDDRQKHKQPGPAPERARTARGHRARFHQSAPFAPLQYLGRETSPSHG